MPSTFFTLPIGLPSIITTAITNLETIQQAARYSISIRGACLNDPLSTISALASALIESLQLIQDIPSLQTLRVGEQIHQVMDLASRLGASMLVIAADRINNRGGTGTTKGTATTTSPFQEEDQEQDQDPTTPTPGQAEAQEKITPDNYIHNHLQTMAGQLSESKKKLFDLVRSVLVGVSGNPKDGFRVDMTELGEVNERVSDKMGVEMRLWERLRVRVEEEEGVVVEGEGKNERETDFMELDDEDVEYLGLPRVSGGMVEQWRATVGQETGITRGNE
ncbi:hypothetical protein B0T20DRAFT_266963 [Sordaria brevicollis]|uniref:Uncharacterized protein n=1 Tax=Sordaria brevicollis TaxID=83679 RepID=A0AAE0PAZ9_SORBR|nr:hypothetical protein B0T20DRAFT_266963 [Sordaria brevicollis]